MAATVLSPLQALEIETLPGEVFRTGGGGSGGQFSVAYLSEPGGTLQNAPLNHVTVSNHVLRAAGQGFAVAMDVMPREGYLVFRIREVTEPAPGSLMQVFLTFPQGSPFAPTPLDYMTSLNPWTPTISWPWIYARGPGLPPGAFALQAPRSDKEFDENLLQMWVSEGLPHPAVEGGWTLPRARQWLADWQETFSDQSCLVVGAENRAQLDRMTDWAARIGMKRIYLHTDTWRGEYWPKDHSYLRVNPAVFPAGEKDLNAYTTGLREKGMGFAVHTTSISIGMNDPDYVLPGLHPELARWVSGTLEQPAGADAGTLHFRPAQGVRYPRALGHEWYGPHGIRKFMNLRIFRIGNELVDAGITSNTDGEVWLLQQCRRGVLNTRAEAHPAGTRAEGILRGYGQAFVPACDSELFRETIRRWAEFSTRNNVNHLECDALEIHSDRPWGPRKFSWLLTSMLTLPSTSNTSGGRPLPFHIEYWFRGSKRVMQNHGRGGVAGGTSLPMFLHTDIRPATGPYEILFKPGQMIAGGGNSFNISYPWPMFGVTTDILDSHGLVPEVEGLLADWRAVLTGITPGQRARMAQAYTAFRSPTGQAGNQPGTDILFRPETGSGGPPRIVPLRMAGRADGELNWGFGQEFGPIVPRQYLQAGKTLKLTNPWPAAEPEFIIRVPGSLFEANSEPSSKPGSGSGRSGNASGAASGTKILASYATGTTTSQAVHPLHAARHIWPAAAMKNGEAMAGTVTLRRVFRLPNGARPEQARLTLQVDDEAEAFVNGKKVFAGGRYDRALFVDVPHLHGGRNEIMIRAVNGGGAGSLAAALHYTAQGAPAVISSDAGWEGRAGDSGNWGPVTELAAYGTSLWPRAEPESGAPKPDLMPGKAAIVAAGGHTLTVEADGLHIACRNTGSKIAAHLDERPGWATSIDMSDARGLGCTVTGDGSGAVLVITIEGRGYRDYAIPIDFTGTRDIEILSGEAAWAHPRWGWRNHSARFDYSRINRVRAGFGTVPAGRHARVTLSRLRPLTLRPQALDTLTIRTDSGGELTLPGLLPAGHYAWYRGGNTVGLYDLNWNPVHEVPIRKTNFRFPQGPVSVTVSGSLPEAHAGGNFPQPWLECQFIIPGAPMEVGAPETR